MTSYSLKLIRTTVLLGSLAAMLPATASAASILFTNFGPSLSYDITQGNPVGNDFAGDNSAEGDSFSTSATATFSSAKLALSCVVCPASESLTVDLTSDSSDSPGTVLETFTLTNIVLGSLGNNNTPITVTSVTHPTLTANTRYWITVSSSVTYSLAWNNNSTGDTHDQAVSTDGGATWFAPSGATPSALEVDGNITAAPEPSTAAFLAAAVLLLGVARKRFSPRRA